MCTLKKYAVKGCTIYCGTTYSGVLNKVCFTNKRYCEIYFTIFTDCDLYIGSNPVSLPPKNQNELKLVTFKYVK